MTFPEKVITDEPVWSVIIMLIILLAGVSYYVYTIIDLANSEMNK